MTMPIRVSMRRCSARERELLARFRELEQGD